MQQLEEDYKNRRISREEYEDRKKQIEKGSIIFHQGETANRFYLIDEGTIELEVGFESTERRIVAGSIGGGGVLGWAWLFPPYEWQFTARALTQTYALFFYATALREHCETDPSLGFELFKRMGGEMVKRLQSARRRLLEVERVSHNSGLSGDSIQRVVQPTVTQDGEKAPALKFDPFLLDQLVARCERSVRQPL